MRRAANVDANQAQVIAQLRKCGVSVQPLHFAGRGVPDLLCGFRNKNILLELKDGAKFPSERKLNKLEQNWHAQWAGQVAVVHGFVEAMDAILAVVEGKLGA